MDTTELDADLATLKSNRDRWVATPLSQKIHYLRAALAGTRAVAARQVQAAARAKKLPEGSPLVGEEWLAGPVCQMRTIRLLIDSLEQVVERGTPRIKEGAVRTRRDGQVAVEVFPGGVIDQVTFAGFRAEIWMQPGVTPQNLHEHMAGLYKGEPPAGKVALVLGAGNVASIGPLDVIHKLFFEGQVCLLKFNPVNDYLGPFVEEAFAALIRDGFLRTAYGGGEVGAYLCQHADVDEIHITGSDRTHDAIVYGVGPEGAARKAADTPVNERRVTSELGNVSPVVVVPGPFTRSDLRFHAENVATQMCNNGGFNCNAAKVLVLHESWPQRGEFLDMLRAVLAAAPQRAAYYPGAAERYDRFVGAHPTAEPIGPRAGEVLPWTLIPDVPSEAPDEMCFTQESWCGVMAQTSLGGADAREFLRNAVDFCNHTLWGTLNACVIIHPRTRQALGEAFEDALADLRYGSVGVNHWPALSYGMGVTGWGAYPGHTRTDIQSGVGVVHNTLMFDAPQKSVIYGPFRIFPKPAWFITNRNTAGVARALVELEIKPGLRSLPRVLFNALRG